MPECIMLVSAVSGAGGSSRDRLLLLVGERDLHCLPLSHIFIPAVLYSLYSRVQLLSSGVQFSFMETLVNCLCCCFLRRLLVSQLLTKVLRYDRADDGLISDRIEGEKADARIQKGSLHLA